MHLPLFHGFDFVFCGSEHYSDKNDKATMKQYNI